MNRSLTAHRITLPAALLTAALLLFTPAKATAFNEGDVFTTMLGKTLDGDKIELAAFRNYRVVLVEFWASWSPPSVERHKQIAEQWADVSNAVWISVCLDRDVAAAKQYWQENPDASIKVCDGKGFESPWAQGFDVVYAPAYYIIDLDGFVRKVTDDLGENIQSQILRARRPPKKGSASAGTSIERPEAAAINDLAPYFELNDLREGRGKFDLDDYEDKVVLLVLFASWNNKSTEYLAEMAKIYESAKASGFELIAVSIETEESDTRRWIREVKSRIKYPVATQRPDDPISITHKKFPFEKDLPWAFLIGKNGVVRDIGNISVERLRQVLVEELNYKL
jgi:peroxiredoxin